MSSALDEMNLSEHPKLHVFAGPNGSGKSTVYDMYATENDEFNKLSFLNVYEAVAAQGIDRFEAAQYIRDESDRLISENTSFCWETVFSQPVKMDYLQYAKACGYRVILYAVCTDHPEINIENVAKRVERGGHDVDQEQIIWRWRSFTSADLYRALDYVTEARLFNFDGLEMIEFGGLDQEGNYHFEHLPEWFKP